MDHHDEEVVVTGASIEATLELWAASLRDVKGRIRTRPVHRRPDPSDARTKHLGFIKIILANICIAFSKLPLIQ